MRVLGRSAPPPPQTEEEDPAEEEYYPPDEATFQEAEEAGGPAQPQQPAHRNTTIPAAQPTASPPQPDRQAGQPQTASQPPQAQPQADEGAGAPDWEELLEQHFPAKRRSLIAPPPAETLANLGAWFKWGGGLVVQPLNWLLDDPGEIAAAESEPMSLLKREMYRLGGALVWVWSAFITQAVTARIFPAVDSAMQSFSKEDFFKHGLTFSVKAFIAAAIFTFMLSAVETMLFDRHKGRVKRSLLIMTFTVDIVINTIGWADFLGHSRQLEWNPLAPLFRGEPIEWGSAFCELAAVLTACLPEIMWEKARRAKRREKASRGVSKDGQGQPGAAAPTEGVWIQTPRGAKFVSREQVAQLAARQARRRAQQQAQQQQAQGKGRER